jgi:type II secretory pathway component PulF
MSSDPAPSPDSGGVPVPDKVKAGPPPVSGGPLSADDLITLNEEIAGMARAGLPLDQGLAALAAEMGRGRLRDVSRQLAGDLQAGLSLPEALERQKGRVPPFYAALLAAAIRSRRIGEVLATLTLYARSIADFRSAVLGALLYPAVVLALGLALLVFAGVAILPQLTDVFQKMQIQVPVITRLLIFVGNHPLETLMLPTVIIIGGLATVWVMLRASWRGRVIWARCVYALPLVGSLIRSARLAAFADTLGILVDQSIPLSESWGLAAAASSDPLLVEGSGRVGLQLAQGVPLGETLKREALVPDLIVWLVAFGEKRSNLGPTLRQVAQLYRRQAEARVALLRTVLPPLIIICLAAVLGALFLFGLMGPMYSVLDGLSGVKKK